MDNLSQLRKVIIEKMIREIKGQTRVDLLVALKDLLFVVYEIQRKEMMNEEIGMT